MQKPEPDHAANIKMLRERLAQLKKEVQQLSNDFDKVEAELPPPAPKEQPKKAESKKEDKAAEKTPPVSEKKGSDSDDKDSDKE